MPVFSFLATLHLTKPNDDGTIQKIERVVLDVPAIVAVDAAAAAAIAGRKIPERYDDEALSTMVVKVNPRA